MIRAALLLAATMLAAPIAAQQAAPQPAPPPPPASKATPPKLIVFISVDQLSADLFAQYRNRFTGGFARLLDGAVFPSAYQSHASTETCPGHSTLLTGFRPTRTGIVANDWTDQRVARADKTVYCAEDERVIGSTHQKYTVSDVHLRVPTLGERMKAADPRTRVVSVAGKDRAAVMMGGHRVDELWWWDGAKFASYAGRVTPPVVERANATVAGVVARGGEPLPLPAHCRPLDIAVRAGDQQLGQGRLAFPAGDARAFRLSPAFDATVFAIAAGLIQDMKLGRGSAIDIVSIGASATDYVGHALGTQGPEMCLQLDQLDRTMGAFFAQLDAWGVDYQVALSADHGGHDATERARARGVAFEQRLDPAVSAAAIGQEIGQSMGLAGPVLLAGDGDIYIADNVPPAQRPRVAAEAVRRLTALPQVQAVLRREEIIATPLPTTPPDTWSLAERVRASYDPERSGDLYLVLRPRVSPIARPGPGYVATHGSLWDYDRRVPILFWRRGMTGFEQSLPVETVDIMPTLAATIGLPVSGQDGRCLDLDPGVVRTCPN